MVEGSIKNVLRKKGGIKVEDRSGSEKYTVWWYAG